MNEKQLKRKTLKELVIIAEGMNLSTTVTRAQYKYYDHVPASKIILIERIIKHESKTIQTIN